MSQENIAVSPALCNELRTVYYTLPSEKIILIANGIAVPEMVQKKADDAPFTIGFVGRFITEKNVDLLIMHFAQLYTEYPKARLIIVGSGSQERILKNLVTVLGLSHVIRFVGTSPDSWYPQFDCFVQISQTEGLSLALLEAMSYQVVPIVSVECNTNMLIQDGFNGVVVEKKELIHGFSRVLDRSFSKECGARARDMVLQNYSIDRLVRDYQKCWIRQLHKSEKRAL
jgi:glycosyltransferase involved in cell wall biosynthesis